MPRAFSESEQADIRARLLAAARLRFGRYGLLKTTVGELAADAGVGKGSFYLFFESKEALFFAAWEEAEAALERELLEDLARSSTPAERVEELLLAAATRLERDPLLRQLTDSRVMAALEARLPAEQLAAHRREDRELILGLARGWKRDGTLRPGIDIELLFDLTSAMVALALGRELLGEDRFLRACRFIAAACARALAGGKSRS